MQPPLAEPLIARFGYHPGDSMLCPPVPLCGGLGVGTCLLNSRRPAKPCPFESHSSIPKGCAAIAPADKRGRAGGIKGTVTRGGLLQPSAAGIRRLCAKSMVDQYGQAAHQHQHRTHGSNSSHQHCSRPTVVLPPASLRGPCRRPPPAAVPQQTKAKEHKAAAGQQPGQAGYGTARGCTGGGVTAKEEVAGSK